jgi:hypothetical protein
MTSRTRPDRDPPAIAEGLVLVHSGASPIDELLARSCDSLRDGSSSSGASFYCDPTLLVGDPRGHLLVRPFLAKHLVSFVVLDARTAASGHAISILMTSRPLHYQGQILNPHGTRYYPKPIHPKNRPRSRLTSRTDGPSTIASDGSRATPQAPEHGP